MEAVKWVGAKLQGDKTASFCGKMSGQEVTGWQIITPVFHGTLLPMEFWTPPRFLSTVSEEREKGIHHRSGKNGSTIYRGLRLWKTTKRRLVVYTFFFPLLGQPVFESTVSEKRSHWASLSFGVNSVSSLQKARWVRFGTQIKIFKGWEELTELAPRSSVRAKKPLSSVFETVLSESVLGPLPNFGRYRSRPGKPNQQRAETKSSWISPFFVN